MQLIRLPQHRALLTLWWGMLCVFCFFFSLPLFSVVVPVYLSYACLHFDFFYSFFFLSLKCSLFGKVSATWLESLMNKFLYFSTVLLNLVAPWVAILWICSTYPFPHLLNEWGKQRKCFVKESEVRFLEEEGERRSRGRETGELVQMNNLYRIPGIVCQGDDGRSFSKPKQTDYENTHTLCVCLCVSQGSLTRLPEAERPALFW